MQQRLSIEKIWISVSLLAMLTISAAAGQPYTYVSNISGNNVAVIDTTTHTKVATISVPGYPSGLAVTPDGSSVYVACQNNGTVAVLSTASNAVVASIPVGTTPIQLAITPNGAQAYVVVRGLNQVAVIDTVSKTVIGTIGVGNRPSAVTFSPDGSKAYVANNSDGTVSVIATASRTVTNTFAANAGPSGVAVLPNGNVYVSNQSANTVTVHDSNGNLLTTIGGFTSPNWVAAAPNGTRVLVTNGNGKSVGVIDTSSNTLMAAITVGNIPTSVAVSSDSTRAYVANEYSFTLSQIDVTSNTVMNTQSSIGAYPFGVAIAPPSGPVCTYSLSQNSASFPASGGSSSVNVITQAGCSWTAVSNQGWSQITGGASGSGNGTVSFSASSNGSSIPLSGTLTIAGQSFSITVAGVPCSYSLSSTSITLGSAGGTGSVNVTAPSGCGWNAGSNQGWSQITGGASGNGNGTVTYSVNANAGSTTLTGTLTIAGLTFTITETGVSCSYSLSSTSITLGSAGGSGSVNVTAPSGCNWTAVSNQGWSQITGGASGSGNGTVTYSVNPNGGNTTLTGTLTIASQTFTITETGLACSYSLSSNGSSVGSGSGAGSVNVTAGGSCGWNATSDSQWLSITAGFSGNGNGTVSFSWTANPGTASRTGNLTVGGQNYALTQAGAAFTPIRVNCGGPQVTDGNGNVWAAGGEPNVTMSNVGINGTTTPALYQTEAWSTGTLQYQYTVPNGSFTVKLKFAEFYLTQAGQRTFNIVINGTTYYSSYDIFAAVGGMTADDLSIPVVVNNGQITIQLVPVTGRAKLNALEIF
jgi:YVTN family beta-propeller protein